MALYPYADAWSGNQTYGAVWHVRPWLSLTGGYFESSQFSDNFGTDLTGGAVVPLTGEGADFSARFTALEHQQRDVFALADNFFLRNVFAWKPHVLLLASCIAAGVAVALGVVAVLDRRSARVFASSLAQDSDVLFLQAVVETRGRVWVLDRDAGGKSHAELRRRAICSMNLLTNFGCSRATLRHDIVRKLIVRQNVCIGNMITKMQVRSTGDNIKLL
jgi:hypothetical protein